MNNGHANFWRLFPEDEPGFIVYSRSPGIYISVPFHFSPSVHIQSQYGGFSSGKLERISHQQEPKGPHRLLEALQKYLRARQIWDPEYKDAHGKVVAELPKPPYGFTLCSDMGGLIMCHDAEGCSVPIDLHFRVWRPDLGYMPRSE